jgi:thiol-disulfide isomerase/thioredoxin
MKKTLIAFILCIFFCTGMLPAQSGLAGRLVLEGDLSALEAAPVTIKVTYHKPGGGYIFDSCTVTNRKFVLKKDIDQPMLISLTVVTEQDRKLTPGTRPGPQDYLSSFYQAGDAKIISGKFLKDSKLSGSATASAALYKELQDSWDSKISEQNQLIGAISKMELTATEKEKKFKALSDSMDSIIDTKVLAAFLNKHIQSPVATYALLQYASRPAWTPRKNMAPEQITLYLQLLPAAYQQLPALQALAKELKTAMATQPGQPAMDFSLPDTAGRNVKLSDLKGKYVLIDFWASWCVPCRKENPNVLKAFHQYRDKGFTVVSISLDKEGMGDAWRQAIRKDLLTEWTHLSDLKGFDSEVAKLYAIKAIPTNFLVGPDGRFLGRNLFKEDLENKLAEVFSDTAALLKALYIQASSEQETDLTRAAWGFSRLRQHKTSDSLMQVVKTKYPKGYAAFNERNVTVQMEKDLPKRIQLFEALVKDFPESEVKDPSQYAMMRRSIALLSVQAGDTAQAYRYLNQIKDPVQHLLGYQGIAKLFANNNQYQEALTWMKPAIDSFTFDAGHPNFGVAYCLLFYANLLYNTQQYQAALQYVQPMYAASKKPAIDLSELYASLLIATGKHAAALPVMEQLIREGDAGVTIKEKLPAVYKAAKGNSNGYSSYLVSLEAAERQAKNKKLAATLLNEAAPAFSLKDLNGKTVSTADLKGKTVLLDFWGTFCGPCIRAFPLMQKAMNEYKNDTSVVFLFVNQEMRKIAPEQRLTDIRGVLADKKVNLPVLLDERISEASFAIASEAFKIRGLPSKVIIDKNGIIRFRISGAEADANNEMESILAMVEIAKQQ